MIPHLATQYLLAADIDSPDHDEKLSALVQSVELAGIGALMAGFLRGNESAFTAFCAANGAEGDLGISAVDENLANARDLFTKMHKLAQDELMLSLLRPLLGPCVNGAASITQL